jgi:hypothetical protein
MGKNKKKTESKSEQLLGSEGKTVMIDTNEGESTYLLGRDRHKKVIDVKVRNEVRNEGRNDRVSK